MTVTRNHVSVSNKICSKFHSLRISAARYFWCPRAAPAPISAGLEAFASVCR